MKSRLLAFFIASVLALAALIPKANAREAQEFQLIVSIDWEGEVILEKDIAEIERFRAKHPDVKIVHFFNAAYYTSPGADATEVNRMFARVHKPGDEIGLHIHGWKDLFEKAFEAKGLRDARFISTNAWEGLRSVNGRVGHDVPIEQYSVEQIEAVISYSVDLFLANGLLRPKSFRAGGWQAGPNVLTALERQGFTIDSSAVDTRFVTGPGRTTPALSEKVLALWGEHGTYIKPGHGTFKLEGRNLLEMPSAIFADYAGEFSIRPYVDDLLRSARSSSEHPRVIHLAFHSETAYAYLERLDHMLELLKREYIDTGRVSIKPAVLTSAGKSEHALGSGLRDAVACNAIIH